MSAKLLYNLSDENPNLNKQFGCMNGILQVFYRQHYPARRVAVVGDELKSLPSSGNTSDNVGDTNISTDNKETEKSSKKKATKEKQRGVSSESSSRLSFSSSPCSSSFSSADISTTTSQFEQPGLIQNPVREPTNGSPRWGGLMMPSDLRELVRSSIHKETRTRDGDEAFLSQSQQPKSARANASPLKESSPSRNSNEWSEGRRVVKLKDSPRFSYDERETRKTGTKLKETPRLSLDSRSNSFRSAKSSCSPEPQELATGHRRTTSSVVAKLMGLDVISDECGTDQNRENRFCDSPRPTPRVETDLQRSRSSDSIKKMIPAKFPMKASPWTQGDGAKNQVKAADAATTTVYGEIQKRLSQLEFKKSEKDLRALKQILEAMEKTQQPVQGATSLAMSFKSSSIVVMNPAAQIPTKDAVLPNVKVGNSRQTRKVASGKQSAMDLTPRPGLYKSQQLDSSTKSNNNNSPKATLRTRQALAADTTAKSPRTPRMQPKKLAFEKQSRPTTPTPEKKPSKIQRQQLGKQQTDSVSPRRKQQGMIKPRLGSSVDQLRDASQRSDSNISLVGSSVDIEVTSRQRLERNCDFFPEQHTPNQRSPDFGFKQSLKPLKVTVEQPSPVSVLDSAAFDEEEDSPSPVRKISLSFKEDDESEWTNKPTCDSNLFQCYTEESADFKSNDHKYISEILLASGLLRDLEYSKITIQLHQTRLPINPGLFFILEQNKTTSNMTLLLDNNKHRVRGGFRQQQNQTNQTEKIRRKLVFDTVNEILAQRFAAEGCITTKPRLTETTMEKRASKEEQLLQTLCSEIDKLQQNNSNFILEEDLIWEDLQTQGLNLKEFEGGETPGIVLDIERMIFRDLISEVCFC